MRKNIKVKLAGFDVTGTDKRNDSTFCDFIVWDISKKEHSDVRIDIRDYYGSLGYNVYCDDVKAAQTAFGANLKSVADTNKFEAEIDLFELYKKIVEGYIAEDNEIRQKEVIL